MSNPKMIRLILSCLTQAIDSVIEKENRSNTCSVNDQHLKLLALEFEKQRITALKLFFLESDHSRYANKTRLDHFSLQTYLDFTLPDGNSIDAYQNVFICILNIVDNQLLIKDQKEASNYALLIKAVVVASLVIALSTLATILTLVLLHVASPPAAFFAIPFILSCIVLILCKQLELPAHSIEDTDYLSAKDISYQFAREGSLKRLSHVQGDKVYFTNEGASLSPRHIHIYRKDVDTIMYQMLAEDNSTEEFELPLSKFDAIEQDSIDRYLKMIRPNDVKTSSTASNPLMLFSNIKQYVYRSTELRAPNRAIEEKIFQIINDNHANYTRRIDNALISKPPHDVLSFFRLPANAQVIKSVIDEFKIKVSETSELTETRSPSK
ncbi:MAG: hypothetical protein Q8R24_06570 [Legionellaceae bacterium]|nr:hypothetical protein [Legionellaceae bacterium]